MLREEKKENYEEKFNIFQHLVISVYKFDIYIDRDFFFGLCFFHFLLGSQNLLFARRVNFDLPKLQKLKKSQWFTSGLEVGRVFALEVVLVTVFRNDPKANRAPDETKLYSSQKAVENETKFCHDQQKRRICIARKNLKKK
jgi:hypothetical protein